MKEIEVRDEHGKKIGVIQFLTASPVAAMLSLGALLFGGVQLYLTFTGRMNDSGLIMMLFSSIVIVLRGLYQWRLGRRKKEFWGNFLDLCAWGTFVPLATACLEGLLYVFGVLPGSMGVFEFFFLLIAGAFMYFVAALIPAAIVAFVLKMLKK